MSKKLIKLTECDIIGIVKEAVKNYMNVEVHKPGHYVDGEYKGYCDFMKRWYVGKLYLTDDGKTYIVSSKDIKYGKDLPNDERHAILCNNDSIEKVDSLKESINSVVESVINEVVNNKRSIINHLYKITKPFTSSRYKDDNWSGVKHVIDDIKNNGYDVSVSVENGGYRNSAGGNTLFNGNDLSYWKEYKLEITRGGITVHGILNANFCGTMEDPYCMYDITCTFF